jgi:hypothetical protein
MALIQDLENKSGHEQPAPDLSAQSHHPEPGESKTGAQPLGG